MREDLAALEAAIGYSFKDIGLLNRALTHKSYRFEQAPHAGPPAQDNEQLEFLGDAVLGFIVSEQLVRLYPEIPEGGLSKRKAHLVSAQRLFEVAERLRLGAYLRLGRGEELTGGRSKRALLANALEAVIAALYLEGGLEAARRFILTHIMSEALASGSLDTDRVNDYKSALQERTQQLRLPTPRYVTVKEAGPEHSKTFTVEVRVGRNLTSRAEGFTKKSAGQKAAQLALEQLEKMQAGDG